MWWWLWSFSCFSFRLNLLHQPWSTLSFCEWTSSFLPVGVSVAPSSDPIWSPEEGLAFKVVWVDCDCRKSPWGAGTGYLDIYWLFHIKLSAHVFCINVMDVFGPFLGLHAFGLPSTPPARVVTLCTKWRLSQRKQLRTPGPGWAGWRVSGGFPDCHQQGFSGPED